VEGVAGGYHLFAASFINGCGLDGWSCNGVVVHATSTTPEGPYTFSDLALNAYQHNPHVVKHPDGTYLLFGIGQANNASIAVPCSNGVPVGKCQSDTTSHVQLHTSRSPFGPWQTIRNKEDGSDHIFTNGNGNPAPYIFPNGSLIVLTSGMHVWYAEHWSGPYTNIYTLPFAEMNANRSDTNQFCDNQCSGSRPTCVLVIEDPFIHFDARAGVWRVLMHQFTYCGKAGAGNANAYMDKFKREGRSGAGGKARLWNVGGYARSKSAELFDGWEYSFEKPAYGGMVEYQDGVGALLDGRERPKIWFNKSSTTGELEPALLINGVRYPPNPNETDIFTFVQPIKGWYDDPQLGIN